MKLNSNHRIHLSEEQVLTTFVTIAVIAFMATNNVQAGVDTTFTSATALLTGWIDGSYGKMAALGVLGVGLSIAIVKQSLMFVAAAVGIAIVAVTGPAIVTGIVTATL